jgi:hypothetical protein
MLEEEAVPQSCIPQVQIGLSIVLYIYIYIYMRSCCLWIVLICVQVTNKFWWGWLCNLCTDINRLNHCHLLSALALYGQETQSTYVSVIMTWRESTAALVRRHYEWRPRISIIIITVRHWTTTLLCSNCMVRQSWRMGCVWCVCRQGAWVRQQARGARSRATGTWGKVSSKCAVHLLLWCNTSHELVRMLTRTYV